MGVPHAHPVPAHVLAAPISVRPVAQILVLQDVTMGVEDVMEVAQAAVKEFAQAAAMDAMARVVIFVQVAAVVLDHNLLLIVVVIALVHVLVLVELVPDAVD